MSPDSKRVLVIDDEPSIRELFRELVTLLGHQVDVAANGADGVQRYHGAHYDLVVTDLLMPGMTGLEVIEAVRRRDPAAAVLMISGSDVDVERHARALGIPLLHKPVHIDEFAAAVSRALGTARN